ncbi:hypothetical protein [Deinococcus misasensis]|uniref:hypothetical protein n=1 Tax=Deinococcus misasensis TaxID=392413 RepID=UPI00054D8AF4|nr:hypothetical protein [Deinococcus misasensis]
MSDQDQLDFDVARLSRVFKETQAWCTAHLDLSNPGGSLRSERLRPEGYPEDWTFGEVHVLRVQEWVARRQEFLRSKPTSAQPAQGRVLVVLTHSDMGCAEGIEPSDGVIEINDLPPWDTWFDCILAEDHPPYVLLAWIPEALVERVQKAMNVSVTEPLLWLEDAATWDQTRRTVERFIDFLT